MDGITVHSINKTVMSHGLISRWSFVDIALMS